MVVGSSPVAVMKSIIASKMFFYNSTYHFKNVWQDCSTVTGTILQQSLARLLSSGWHDCSTVTGIIVQQSLARLFNSGWHDYSTVTGTIIKQSLERLVNNHWHYCSTVAGTIIQQSLARLFNSRWHGYSTAAGTIIQQSLAQLFNSHWHNYSAVADTILQQYFFSTLAEFFNSDVHCWKIVPCTRNTKHDPKTYYSVNEWFIKFKVMRSCPGFVHHKPIA